MENTPNHIGKLTSFRRLIAEESAIMIPKVQRDYAYGRDEEKVKAILDTMLDTMLNAVENNTTELFDFVYGGNYISSSNSQSGLIPLDGQQRLTTMFLLFFYASLISDANEEDVEILKKFRYETRQSATDFCVKLIDYIRPNILNTSADDKKNKRISSLIRNDAKYLPSYDFDPTITSMLNVLDVIEEKVKAKCITDLWDKLTTRDNIQFYSLSLSEFGLTDDLYIKMNSRGKKLTKFEIFKSDIEKAIYNIDPSLKDEFSKKIDNEWMDILWNYANLQHTEDMVSFADNGFMHLFNNIFRLELFRRGIETANDRLAEISEIITDRDSIIQIISIFDVIAGINKKNGGIEFNWFKYFYFSNDAIGENERIKLFWIQPQNQKPVFHLAMERSLGIPAFLYFYSIYLIEKNKIEEITARKRLRIVRNLVTANTRANHMPYYEFKGYLDTVEYIILNGTIPQSANFNSVMVAEENLKLSIFEEEIYNKLLHFENHSILQGSLGLFIDKYYDSAIKDATDLTNSLDKFERIFCNGYNEKMTEIKLNFLSKETEYMQYTAGMDNNYTRRYFLHRADNLGQFFIKNDIRKNQKAILEIIDKLPSTLLSRDQKCNEFNKHDWQYYMSKYPWYANFEWTKYGCFAWDDKVNRPLEIIILNSSYHSKDNIEWIMMNSILYGQLYESNEDKNKYSFDKKSSPVVVNKYGITLTFKQEGWIIDCNTNVANIIISNYNSNSSILDSNGNKTKFLVSLSEESGFDYIELGHKIVNEMEAIYEKSANIS